MGEAKMRARALVSLKDWLDEHVPSQNAEERDTFADFSEWIARLLEAQADPSDKAEGQMLRLLKIMSLAVVEGGNHEDKLGYEMIDTAPNLARAMGLAFGYGLMSLSWKDGAPFRSMPRAFSEIFASGMKFAIDECEEAGRHLERFFHRKFGPHNLHGEWFSHSSAIEAFLSALPYAESEDAIILW